MKMFGGPRQPFVGLALAAAVGIALGDVISLPHPAVVLTGALAAIAGIFFLWRPNPVCVYLLVVCSFLVLHNVRTSDTPGLWLSARLGDRPRVITAIGAVVSEPKIAANGIATFLLRLTTIELEGKTESTNATILVRWRSAPRFGDELKLFGSAVPIAPPRNPGEFDMRSYLARRDVRCSLF